MNLPDAIAELGHQIGLPGLALDQAGLCRVVFDGALKVDFEAAPGGQELHIVSMLEELNPATCGPEVLQSLLEANHLGVATGGAHFSFNTAAGEILFERKLSMTALDFTGFAQAVEQFVNYLEGWRMKLAASA